MLCQPGHHISPQLQVRHLLHCECTDSHMMTLALIERHNSCHMQCTSQIQVLETLPSVSSLKMGRFHPRPPVNTLALLLHCMLSPYSHPQISHDVYSELTAGWCLQVAVRSRAVLGCTPYLTRARCARSVTKQGWLRLLAWDHGQPTTRWVIKTWCLSCLLFV